MALAHLNATPSLSVLLALGARSVPCQRSRFAHHASILKADNDRSRLHTRGFWGLRATFIFKMREKFAGREMKKPLFRIPRQVDKR
jgi:hypothetical protein